VVGPASCCTLILYVNLMLPIFAFILFHLKFILILLFFLFLFLFSFFNKVKLMKNFTYNPKSFITFAIKYLTLKSLNLEYLSFNFFNFKPLKFSVKSCQIFQNIPHFFEKNKNKKITRI
jgi:hypothetical protein